MGFFESAADDIKSLEEKYLGPRYSYTDYIKSPEKLKMSSKGSRISENVDGIQSYVELLFEGGGNASSIKGPLGKQYFLKTGAKCKETKSKQLVTRSLYINNIPIENTTINKGMTLIFDKAQGLIPGILNNIGNINPLSVFGAFLEGTNPDCKLIKLPTIDEKNRKGKKSAYLTINDIKNLSPCLFSNNRNPLTRERGSCIEGLENNIDNYNDDLEILDYLFPAKKRNLFEVSDIIAYLYFISLTILFLSLIKKSK